MISPQEVSQLDSDHTVPAPPLEWIGTFSAQLGQPVMIGQTAHGTRMIQPAVSGTLQGPGISGTMLPITGDWPLVRPDGVAELDVRGTIEMQDGALLYMNFLGYIPNVMELMPRWQQGEAIPRDTYSFVVTVRFETAAPAYDWLQHTVAIGVGLLVPGGVSYEIFVVRA